MLVNLLKPLALCGPIAWCARWHNRVMRCQMQEWFDLRQMTLRDLLPWAPTLPVLVEVNDASSAKQQLSLTCCSTNYPVQAQQQELLAPLDAARGLDCQVEGKS